MNQPVVGQEIVGQKIVGEPLVLQNHTRLAGTFDEVARDLAGLGQATPRDASRSGGFFARLGGRR